MVCVLLMLGSVGDFLAAQDDKRPEPVSESTNDAKSVDSEQHWIGEVRTALTEAAKRLKSTSTGQAWTDEVQTVLSEAEKRLKSTASSARTEELQNVLSEASKRLKSTAASGNSRNEEVREILSDVGQRLLSLHENSGSLKSTASGHENSGALKSTASGHAVQSESDVAASLQSSVPKITSIPGGYYAEFSKLTEIGAVQLGGPMTGKFEIFFDNRMEDIGAAAKPVSNPDFLLVLADYWIVRGKPERAIPLYEVGLEKQPDNFLFQNNLALLVSTAEKDHSKALNIIDGALKDRADNVTLLDTKGLIMLNAKRADEAVPVLQRAVELSCQKPLCVMHYAYALDMQGSEASAKEWFSKAQPLLETSANTFLKDDKNMFDYLKMKYNSASSLE